MQVEKLNVSGAPPVTFAADYDNNNRRTLLACNIGGGTANFDYGCGMIGTFTGFTGHTDDFVNTYTYDPLSRLEGIAQTGQTSSDPNMQINGVESKSVALGYDFDSRLTTVDMYQNNGNGNVDVAPGQYTYNHDSQLTDLAWGGPAAATYHWDYNAAGLVSDMYSLRDSISATGSYKTWAEASYNYDPSGQLATTTSGTTTHAVTYTNWNDPNNPWHNLTAEDYNYDPNGNPANAAPPPGATTVTGPGNRLLYDGTYYYTYDAEGNRTAQYQISGTNLALGPQNNPNPNATNITVYTWNAANQMASATYYLCAADYSANSIANAGEWRIYYGYDPFGRMVSRSATITQGSPPVPTTSSESFIYDGQNVALVFDGHHNVIERELAGPGAGQVYGSERPAAAQPNQTQQPGPVNWYCTDNQGSVRDVVQGVPGNNNLLSVDYAAHLVYGGCGQLTGLTAGNAGDEPTFYYGGAFQDPQTGMYKEGARWYDAVRAVFASQDPIGFGGGDANTERYCGNSAPNFVDPSGLKWVIGGTPPPGAMYQHYLYNYPNGGSSVWQNIESGPGALLEYWVPDRPVGICSASGVSTGVPVRQGSGGAGSGTSSSFLGAADPMDPNSGYSNPVLERAQGEAPVSLSESAVMEGVMNGTSRSTFSVRSQRFAGDLIADAPNTAYQVAKGVFIAGTIVIPAAEWAAEGFAGMLEGEAAASEASAAAESEFRPFGGATEENTTAPLDLTKSESYNEESAPGRWESEGGVPGPSEAPNATSQAAQAADRLHHSWPQYLGGPVKQKLQSLPKAIHDAYHSGLDKILPRQIRGGALEYYRSLSPAEQAANFQKFMDYTQAFDAKYGTKLWEAVVDEATRIK